MTGQILASSVAWITFSQVLSRGSTILAAIILARHFDTSDFASFGYFQMTISMLGTYAGLGLGVAASRFFAEYKYTSRSAPEESLLGVLWIAGLVLSLVGSAVVLVLPGDLIGAGFDIPKWLFVVAVLIASLQVVPAGAVIGLEEYRRVSLVSLGTGVILLAGTLSAIRMDSIRTAMVSVLVASTFQLLGQSAVVLKRVGWTRLGALTSSRIGQIGKIVNVSLPLAVSGMLTATGSWLLGRIILGGPGGHHAFALFSIGMQWFALALFLPANISRALLPQMVRHAATNDVDRRRHFVLQKAVGATLLASALVAAAGLVFSPLVLRLYGQSYEVAAWLIAAYMAAGVLGAPVTTLGNALVAYGAQWHRLALTIVWVVVLLVSAYGSRGALEYGGAIAVAIAYGSLSFGLFLLARRLGLA